MKKLLILFCFVSSISFADTMTFAWPGAKLNLLVTAEKIMFGTQAMTHASIERKLCNAKKFDSLHQYILNLFDEKEEEVKIPIRNHKTGKIEKYEVLKREIIKNENEKILAYINKTLTKVYPGSLSYSKIKGLPYKLMDFKLEQGIVCQL